MTFEEEERKRLNEYYEKNKKRIFQDMSLVNCEGIHSTLKFARKAGIKIRTLKDLPIADASLQYRMESENGCVDFAILDGELCAHTWECPKEGREFLKSLEEYAKKKGLKLTIPTVLNPALAHILKTSGYKTEMVWVDCRDDFCELWSKEKK